MGIFGSRVTVLQYLGTASVLRKQYPLEIRKSHLHRLMVKDYYTIIRRKMHGLYSNAVQSIYIEQQAMHYSTTTQEKLIPITMLT